MSRRRHEREDPRPEWQRQAARGPRIVKPKDSVEYAWQTCELIKLYWHSYQVEAARWDDLLAEAERDKIYERLPPPPATPYGSMDSMLKAELGVNHAESRAEVARRAQALAADPAIGALGTHGGRRKQGSNTPLSQDRGVSRLVRRLKRDAPEMAERLARGEFRSARAAAMAAGLPMRRTIAVPDDPGRAFAALVRRYGQDKMADVVEAFLRGTA